MRRVRTANVVTALALGVLMGGIAFTAPRWARWLSEPRLLEDDPSLVVRQGAGSSHDDGSGSARRTISVRAFFVSAETGGLVPEEREVEFSPELATQVRNVVAALLLGSTSGLESPFPEGVRVQEVFLTARGVAYVSLSPEAQGIEGGATGEILAVYSIVNTIVTNFASIRKVQILVGDRMADTLAGHIDLSRPLSPDLTLLAPLYPRPSPGPSVTPSPSAAAGVDRPPVAPAAAPAAAVPEGGAR